MKDTKHIVTFAEVEKEVKAALAGTKYEGTSLVEYGGGDGPEDIKPFLIARKGGVDFGATGFPEGGILFWVWGDEGVQEEYTSAAEAVAAFEGV